MVPKDASSRFQPTTKAEPVIPNRKSVRTFIDRVPCGRNIADNGVINV